MTGTETLKLNMREGTWTIQNEETGEHRTFRISTKQKGVLKGKMVVSLMTGTDNESHYTAFAFLNDNKIYVWKRLRGSSKPSAYDVYAHMLGIALSASVDAGQDSVEILGRIYRVILADYCRRCGKMLTNPQSCDLHVGPECRKHYGL